MLHRMPPYPPLPTRRHWLAAAWLHLRAPEGDEPDRRWVWLAGGLVAVDLLIAGWGLNPPADLELYKEGPGIELRAKLGDGRLYIPEDDEYRLKFERLFRFEDFYGSDPNHVRSTLLPNIAMLDGIPSANNFDPLVPGRYKALIARLKDAGDPERLVLLEQMGVAMIETADEDINVSITKISGLPRARWAECGEVIEDNEAVDPCSQPPAGSIEIIRDTANTVSAIAESPTGGWLILADTFYPGWGAYANGEPLTIHLADGIFRAVHVDAGRHELRFVYRPASFYAGLAISVASWFCLSLLWRRYPIQ